MISARARPAEPLSPLLGPELTDAACKGMGGMFDDHTDPPEPATVREERHRAAIDICLLNCPARVDCLNERLADNSLGAGIFGGQLFNTYRRARAQPSTQAA